MILRNRNSIDHFYSILPLSLALTLLAVFLISDMRSSSSCFISAKNRKTVETNLVLKIQHRYNLWNVSAQWWLFEIKKSKISWKKIDFQSFKVYFHKLFANSATRWVFLRSKIISNIAKSVQIFYESFYNNGKLKIWYDFAMVESILQHRNSHRVTEFTKSL